jgi:ATP-dependent Zn protease
MKNRPTTKSAKVTNRHWDTAYHEAGHAALCWWLGVPLGKKGVTIVSDGEGAAGSTTHRKIVGHDLEGRVRSQETQRHRVM